MPLGILLPLVVVAQSCLTLCDPMGCSLQAPLPMDFFKKITRVGHHSLLQGIFPTQGLNPGLPHCRQMLYRLEDPMEEEVANHPSILAWKIPWREGPGGLQSTGWQIIRHDWEYTDTYTHIMHTHTELTVALPNSRLPSKCIYHFLNHC